MGVRAVQGTMARCGSSGIRMMPAGWHRPYRCSRLIKPTRWLSGIARAPKELGLSWLKRAAADGF